MSDQRQARTSCAVPHAGCAATASPPPAAALVDTCVHCGFCLPACPTYALWGEEMDSPRGRIYLMKAALDGRVEMDDGFVRHFDACLGCMACVTACPSGVQYGPLIEATRGQIEAGTKRPLADRLFRRAVFWLRIALLPLAAWTVVARLWSRVAGRRASTANRPPAAQGATSDQGPTSMFARVRAAMALAPTVTFRALFRTVDERTPAVGARRMTVGLLTGCVQRLVFAEVNAATVRVLAAEGCEVVAPRSQGCCGALALHAGRLDDARCFARGTIAAFERAGVDVVAVNAAGCGSSMKEYAALLADDPAWADRARAFAIRVRDVTELVGELQPARATRHPIERRVAYHDACHLAHAQGIRQAPRDLLRSIPGIELLAFPEPDMCCGSAGIYNLVESVTARQLGDRKVGHIDATQPEIVSTANPGCTLQIAAAAARAGRPWIIRHPIEILDASIQGRQILAVVVRAPSVRARFSWHRVCGGH